MSLVRLALATSSLAIVVLAAWVSHPYAGETLGYAREISSPSPLPNRSPEFHPGPQHVSGRVVRPTAGGALLESAGQEVEVSFGRIVEVWRETSVAPNAIQVGDDLFVSGAGGSPFVATYVWANIGRIDGVIRDIDALGMLVEVQLRWGGTKLQHIDFSPYIEYGYAGGPRLTRADLAVGRTIGAVVYGRPGESLRATRVW